MLEARYDKTEFDSIGKVYLLLRQRFTTLVMVTVILNCQANEQKIYSSQSLERNLVGLRK